MRVPVGARCWVRLILAQSPRLSTLQYPEIWPYTFQGNETSEQDFTKSILSTVNDYKSTILHKTNAREIGNFNCFICLWLFVDIFNFLMYYL
jgi:hypothetical protein